MAREKSVRDLGRHSSAYHVETGALVRAMKLDRFPEDFAFQLTKEEFDNLRSQTESWGGRRYAPYAFTEQGVAMLSGILRSKIAVQVNVAIMRTFVRLRRMLATTGPQGRPARPGNRPSSSTSKGYWSRPNRRKNIR